MATSNVDIAFTGDTIVERWLTSAVAPDSINLGIGVDTIEGLLERSDSDVIDHIPTWYISIGINDAIAGRSILEIPALTSRIASAFKGADKVLWSAVLPVARENWTNRMETFRNELNVSARRACASMPNCTFIGAPSGYAERVSEFTSDGLHPNVAGYNALSSQLCSVVSCDQ